MTEKNNSSSVRVVIFNRPGPAWQEGTDPMQQIGVLDHVEHLDQLKKEGKIELSGPFISGDTGGMVLVSSNVTLEEARNMAHADPSVVSGLFDIEVRQWLAS